MHRRNEYLIFQKIIKLEYEFPEKFFPKAKDLVKQLLVSLKLQGAWQRGGAWSQEDDVSAFNWVICCVLVSGPFKADWM